ncbi:hypothetical protein ACFSW8_14265 [Rubritalea tangerina]|uniref:Lipoprotein n=1 Tax=Rubritalea tangerina TaxID=430798 RepID=A0ABW4ZEY4_9BACT
MKAISTTLIGLFIVSCKPSASEEAEKLYSFRRNSAHNYAKCVAFHVVSCNDVDGLAEYLSESGILDGIREDSIESLRYMVTGSKEMGTLKVIWDDGYSYTVDFATYFKSIEKSEYERKGDVDYVWVYSKEDEKHVFNTSGDVACES